MWVVKEGMKLFHNGVMSIEGETVKDEKGIVTIETEGIKTACKWVDEEIEPVKEKVIEPIVEKEIKVKNKKDAGNNPPAE